MQEVSPLMAYVSTGHLMQDGLALGSYRKPSLHEAGCINGLGKKVEKTLGAVYMSSKKITINIATLNDKFILRLIFYFINRSQILVLCTFDYMKIFYILFIVLIYIDMLVC